MNKYSCIEKNRSIFFFENTYDNSYDDNENNYEEDIYTEEDYINDITSMELPMDWENVLYDDKRAQGVHAESISDGLIMSLSNMGCVDIEYISAITGRITRTL